MYINDLGISGNHSIQRRDQIAKTAGRAWKSADSYATVMKKAVEEQKTTASPVFASAGDIIIKEAFEKMKTDPEWEKTVMDQVKEYYTGNRKGGGAGTSFLSWTGQNSLQNYLLGSLTGGQNILGYTGYSPYGSNLAAAAYGSMMNSICSSSLFGNYYL